MNAMNDILDRIHELQRRDSARAIFGAASHHYRIQPATEATVALFEEKHQARLPAAYRRLLLEVTDGGAGPGYGLFPLERRQGDEVAEDLSLLGQPFNAAAFFSLEAPDIDPVDDADAYEEAMDRYWREMPGTMTLCHYGCAIRASLVVTGAQAGQVIIDQRCDQVGVYPFTPARSAQWHGRKPPLTDYTPLDVVAWYGDWLDASLAALAG